MKRIKDYLSGLFGNLFGGVSRVTYVRDEKGNLVEPTATPAQQYARPTASPTASPTPTPTPRTEYSPTPAGEYQHQIPYQMDDNKRRMVKPDLSHLLLKVFDPIGAATESASVLAHPRERTMLPQEEAQYNQGRPYISGGENRSFKTGREVDIPNNDGSIDRGLFRINSNILEGWMSNHKSRERLAEYGITDWDDMLDPEKNMVFARLLMESTSTQYEGDRSWRKWWAAPLLARHPSLKHELAKSE